MTPIAYPFGFYVNPGVKSFRCTYASGAANVNNFCVDDSGCGGTAGNHTLCTAQTINNLTRLQVVALFSGVVSDWSDFGVYYPAIPVTLCMRHAGSGTSATLDYAVMNNGWGNALYEIRTTENRAASGTRHTFTSMTEPATLELSGMGQR